jgi:hypothetical protein
MSVDTTIVATALDTLQQALGTSIKWAGWTITAYSFGYVVFASGQRNHLRHRCPRVRRRRKMDTPTGSEP